jgi:hypothetical protein
MSALATKLGLTPNSRSLVIGPVPEAVLAQLFGPHRRPSGNPYDVILAFCLNCTALDRQVAALPRRLTTAGGLWLAWPKRSSGVRTDITEAAVRAAGLDSGLVDNKIAAVDVTWSALRFVRRLADR